MCELTLYRAVTAARELIRECWPADLAAEQVAAGADLDPADIATLAEQAETECLAVRMRIEPEGAQ